jgi:hypothetical protein
MNCKIEGCELDHCRKCGVHFTFNPYNLKTCEACERDAYNRWLDTQTGSSRD